jgi:hypothetical protein
VAVRVGFVDVELDDGVDAPVTLVCVTVHVYVAPLTPFVVRLTGAELKEQIVRFDPETVGTGLTLTVVLLLDVQVPPLA